MRVQYGKLYQNVKTKEFKCFSYDPTDDYYANVKNITEQGYRQIIFTSSVMLSLIENFLLFYNASIVSIEFMEEDEELDVELKNILSMLKNNGAYWGILKEKLAFLSRYDSVDIKRALNEQICKVAQKRYAIQRQYASCVLSAVDYEASICALFVFAHFEKRVEIRVSDGDGFFVSMQVNGIVTVTESAYYTVTNEIGKVVGRVLA